MFDCYDLFDEVQLFYVMKWEIRLHGRGGQGVVTASKIIAEAAFAEGYQSQSIPFFGAERRGSPVTAFTRISEHEIRERSQIYHPDYLLILDPLVMRTVDVFQGLKSGGGVVISSPSAIERDVFPNIELTVGLVDGVGVSIRNDLVVAGNLVVNIPAIGAFLRIFPEISIDCVEKIVLEKFGNRSVRALYSSYDETEVFRIRGSREKKKEERKKPEKVWIPASKPAKGVAGITGYWRDFRPVIDYGRCTGCLNCWIHCPEGSISRKNGDVEIDYTFCKGCLVCLAVCPRKAISSEREVSA